MRLTKNFILNEFLTSQAASRNGIQEQFNPPENVILNLKLLCSNILQPLRNNIKEPIIVSSGYRYIKVNKIIGGAENSQHVEGQAADIQIFKSGNEYLFNQIIDLELPFDQLINEFNFDWIHVSFSSIYNRKQILEAKRITNKTHYIKYKR